VDRGEVRVASNAQGVRRIHACRTASRPGLVAAGPSGHRRSRVIVPEQASVVAVDPEPDLEAQTGAMTPSTPAVVVVLSTVANPEDGATLIRALLERRLIACGTMLPGARSLYRWEGRITDESETVLLLKTRPELVPSLKHTFPELHPYTVPELLVLSSTSGLEQYAAWVMSETADGTP
jgi:periplasmic divalent cation tolerance protein